MTTILKDRRIAVIAAVLAVIAVSFGVVRLSAAAFTDTTSTAANTWTSGTVAIDNDRAGTAAFTATGVVPGYSQQRCIVVTYTGSVAAQVRLFVTAPDGATQGLDEHLRLTVESAPGSHGVGGACQAGFDGAGVTAHASGSMDHVLFTYGDWDAAFTPYWDHHPVSAPETQRTYRITAELPVIASDDAQGETASALFTWEARNS